jgi:drug/metabolite transporter (DMT)-like permease
VRRDALAAGLIAVCLWGLAPVATRAAVAHLSPLPLLLIRLGAASLVLLPWALPVFRRLRPRAAGRLAAAGLLGLVGYNLPVTVGLRWLPASTAGLLLATEPVWVMVLGRLLSGERGGGRAWLGSAAALAGVAVLAGPGAVGGIGGDRALAGAGLVLAATLAFGAYTIVLRPLSEEYGAVPATAASTVVGSLPYVAFAGMLPGAGLAHLGTAVWAELAFLALGSTAAGLLLWSVAVLAGGIARVSLLLYLEPAVSVLGAAVFLGEPVTLVMVGGGALILSGVAVAGTGRAPARAPAPETRPERETPAGSLSAALADVGQGPDDLLAQLGDEPGRVGHRVGDLDQVDPELGVLLHLAQEAADVALGVNPAEDRLLDGVVVAPLGVAVRAEHVELVADVRHRRAEQVARVGVLRDQAQGLLLPSPADEDRRARRLQRPRDADRLRQLVVLALVGAVVVAPHLLADLQRLLEPLEPLGDRRVRHAEGAVLALVPGRADAEHRPAAGQHVEGGDDLGEQTRVPVGDPADKQAEPQPLGLGGDEVQHRVALEHRVARGREVLHLEVVVHRGEPAEPGLLGRDRGVADRGPQGGTAVGVAEIHEVHAEFHF